MRDIVQIHIGKDLPIRAQALPFANRIEVRLGKAFPLALLVDDDALSRFMRALEGARSELDGVPPPERPETPEFEDEECP